MTKQMTYILVFIVYIGFCMAIPTFIKMHEKRKSAQGFLLGDRNIGPWPTAFSLMSDTKLLTTLKLTSASSKATLISLSISSMLDSLSRVCPRSFLKTCWKRSDSDSNAMGE